MTLDKPRQRAYGGPMTSTNNDGFLVGDKVSYEGIVTAVTPTTVSVSKTGEKFGNAEECLWSSNITLVERPQPKVAVELTYEQLDRLCVQHVDVRNEDPLYVALCAARQKAAEALDARS